MDPNRLKGKNILITGRPAAWAHQCRSFAAQGANVCLGDLDLDEGAKVADGSSTQAGNGKAIAVKMDVTKREDNAAAVAPRSTPSDRSMWALQCRPEQAPVLHGYR
jgi:NAD(P)-dependent dehydrogenase (short-subunit alcohol dehydrogenase family)